jgi:succinoglycan biosynthesis transport protein ExoP
MIFSHNGVRGAADESLRLLAHRLRRIRERRPMKTIVIASATPREGKTIVAVNLAATLAANSCPVALIDGDLRSASVPEVLGVPALPGLAECLEGEQSPEEHLFPVSPLAFDLMQAGSAKRNPAELLQSPRLQEVTRNIARKYEWVVIDTPPITPFVDAQCLAAAADAVVVVVRAMFTSRDSIAHTIESLKDVYVAGIVLNGDDTEHTPYYKYYSRSRISAATPPAVEATAGPSGHD